MESEMASYLAWGMARHQPGACSTRSASPALRFMRCPLCHARNGVHQLAIGNILQAVKRKPFAVAPARVEPAGENRQMLLPLAHGLLRRLERIFRFAQLLIERDRLALSHLEGNPVRRLPRALPHEPQFHRLRLDR